MRKNNLSTFVLLLMLAALAGWYFLYEKKYRPKQMAAEEKAKQIVSLDKDAIQEIDLDRYDSTKKEYLNIKLKKTGSDWNLLAPIQDIADLGTVNSILSSLTNSKEDRVVDDEPKDLDLFGLKTPKFKLTVRKDGQAAPVTLLIGADTPVGSGLFVKLADSKKVLKTGSGIKFAIDKDVTALRHKSIFSLSRFDVGEIELQNPKGDTLLKKTDKDNWSLARENIPASTAEVNRLLNAVVDLRATGFPSEAPTNLAEFGLAQGAIKVTLSEDKTKTRIGLLVGKVKERVYAKREDKSPVYEVDKEFYSKVSLEPNAYRSFDLANFGRFDVKRLKLERAKDSLEFLKDGTNWTIPTDPAMKVDTAKVDGLIASIQDTRIAKYKTGKAEIKSPALTVRVLEMKDNKEVETVVLKFGPPAKDNALVVRNGLDIPFEIRTSDFKKIDLAKKDFLKVELPKATPAPQSHPEKMIPPQGKSE